MKRSIRTFYFINLYNYLNGPNDLVDFYKYIKERRQLENLLLLIDIYHYEKYYSIEKMRTKLIKKHFQKDMFNFSSDDLTYARNSIDSSDSDDFLKWIMKIRCEIEDQLIRESVREYIIKHKNDNSFKKWTSQDVTIFLIMIGLDKYSINFFKRDINGEKLKCLTDKKLISLGLSKLGKRIRVRSLINKL